MGIPGDWSVFAATGTAVSEVSAAVRSHRAETSYGASARSFRLPETVNAKVIVAELADGILRLVLLFDTEKATKQRSVIR